MPYQIVFHASDESRKDLLAAGFEERTVLIKSFTGSHPNTTKQCEEGDAQLLQMKNKPNQFITTSYWFISPSNWGI